MEYRRFQNTIVIRMDPGEEIMKTLRDVCQTEQVQLASISALGAVSSFTVGLFNLETKAYQTNTFQGAFEITSLTGTVTEQDGQPYLHMHMSAADDKGIVRGGHLDEATVSATCEMVIRVIQGRVQRQFDEKTGLNLFHFTD